MKKRIIKIIIILLITIAFIGVAVYLTTGFLNKREVKQDIETTLDSIKSGDANQERYIYEVQMTASNTDNSSKENLITSKITYKIQKIKINKRQQPSQSSLFIQIVQRSLSKKQNITVQKNYKTMKKTAWKVSIHKRKKY